MTGDGGLYIRQVETGLMQNFNYLIGDPRTHECAYVDPAWEPDRLLKIAKDEGFKVTKILLTHNHFDHIEGVEAVVAATGAEVFINKNDDRPLQKGKGRLVSLADGQDFKIGNLVVTALNTPGHTPGSTCYLVKVPGDPIQHLFTGDTLFQGNCGRSDLPGGDPKILFKSLGALRQLDPATKVYPGHDYGVIPVTSIGYERQHNPTLRAKSFEDFDRLP
jgi:hydroxyacylglutathione hydrolase